jgi:hypothetical protein
MNKWGMNRWMRSGSQSHRQGFTLVVTLTILAAVTILVVGLFGIVGRERQVSGTYDSVDQADLAVQAGLEDASSMLKQALADELGVIFAAQLNPAVDEHGRQREVLLTGRFNPEISRWQYQTLASGVAAPAETERLTVPNLGFEVVAGPRVTNSNRHFLDPRREGGRLPRASPWMAAKPKYWLEVRLPQGIDPQDTEERLVGRYCFEVEDVQSRISLASAGLHDPQPAVDSPIRHEVLANDVPMTLNPLVPGLVVDEGGRWRRQSSSIWTLLEPGWEWLPSSLGASRWPMESPATLSASKGMHRLLASMEAKRLFVSPESWRELLMSPNPMIDWAGLQPEVFRQRYEQSDLRPEGVALGALRQPQLRALEQNVTAAWAPYDELALVPHDAGFALGGEPKLNLNELLIEAEAHQERTNLAAARQVVERVADHIDRHLPKFRKRAGGYTLPRATPLTDREVHEKAYLKALAAGMIDYADRDVLPTMNIDQGGAGRENGENSESLIEYRGMDAFPLVNELWQRHRYERVLNNGRTVEYSLTDYVELWNMTDQEVSGEVLLSFEYRGRLLVGSEVYPVMTEARGDRVISGKPITVDGLEGLWLRPEPQKYGSGGSAPSGGVTLKPNEITVLRCPPVLFRLDGSGIETITGVQYFGQPAYGNDERESRYRLAFRPRGASEYTVVDLPFATLERYQLSSTAGTRQRFNVNQCGLSYRLRDRRWAFNVGDTRGAYFIDYHQEVIDYVNGSSPWGRNFRRFARMAGEVRTFLWPDGGHNSLPSPQRIGDMNHNPVDGPAPVAPTDIAARTRPAVSAANNAAERLKSIQHLSSLGRIYSATELGHIFDPIMWNPNGNQWADVEVLYGQHADIPAEVFEESLGASALDAHKRFCGGNTLRIGRVEHSAFRPDYRMEAERDEERPVDRGMAASSLLDLFHCGNPNAVGVEQAVGPLNRIDGHVNVNTASKDVLRALIAGRLQMDPLLAPSSDHDPRNPNRRIPEDEHGRGNSDLAEPNVMVPASSDPAQVHADLVAEAIIQNRPYVTPAEVAEKAIVTEQMRPLLERYESLERRYKDLTAPVAMGMPVFGFTARADPERASIEEDRRVAPEWNDRAAEEGFSRLWNNATTRSRHFVVTVTGQAVRRSRSGEEVVEATRSRQFQVFVRPVRNAEGNLIQQVVEVTHSRGL